MNAVELPPVRVSPFIRGCRYLALGSGFLYGVMRFKYLRRKENKRREIEQKQKVILDAKKAEEKQRMQKEEMLSLAKACNITPPAGF